VRHWQEGNLQPIFEGGKFAAQSDDLGALFGKI
jgi:hypothetical protein